jgi:hypothetical protein
MGRASLVHFQRKQRPHQPMTMMTMTMMTTTMTRVMVTLSY